MIRCSCSVLLDKPSLGNCPELLTSSPRIQTAWKKASIGEKSHEGHFSLFILKMFIWRYQVLAVARGI